MKLKLFAIFFITITTNITLAADKIKPKTIIFKVAHGPAEVIFKPLQKFRTEVEAKSNGRIKVKISFPKVYQDTNQEKVKEVYEDLKAGKVQMSQLYTYLLAEYDKNYFALDLPFIFNNHEHAFAAVDGVPGNELLSSLELNSNLKGFGFTYSGGLRSIASKNLKINTFEDIKKLELNKANPLTSLLFSKAGAKVSNKFSKESITKALDEGKINGFETVIPRYFHSGDYKKAPILNALDYNIQFTVVLINKNFFNSLSVEDQKIISDAASNSVKEERKQTLEVAEEVLKDFKKHQIQLIRLSKNDQEKLKDVSKQIDWIQSFNISKEFIQKLIDAK